MSARAACWSTLAVLAACAREAPAGGTSVPSSPARDPWEVPSGAGIAGEDRSGEPDVRLAPPPEPRPPRTDSPRADSLGNLHDGPTGSPPAERRPVSQVEARMSSIRARMRRCFDKALAADPNLRGPSAARLDFGPDGKPVRVTFGGKPPRPGLETCLADVIRQGLDPSAEGAASITIPISESAGD